MSRNPLVSVVIPAYNRRDTVCDTIESVLAQSFAPHEIIVVDDGSTDGSADAIVAAFGSSVPRVQVVQQANAERGAARNRGVEIATGEWMAFVDSDDIWLPNKLARQFARLAETGAGGCFSGFCRVHGDGSTHESVLASVPGQTEGALLPALVRSNVIATSTCLVRRSELLAAGLFCEDRKLSAFEDWDMWLRLAAKMTFCYVPEVLCEYRVHPGNTGKPMNASVCRQVARRLRRHVPGNRWRSELCPAFALRYADLMDRDASAGLRRRVLAAGCRGSSLFGPGVMMRAVRLAFAKA